MSFLCKTSSISNNFFIRNNLNFNDASDSQSIDCFRLVNPSSDNKVQKQEQESSQKRHIETVLRDTARKRLRLDPKDTFKGYSGYGFQPILLEKLVNSFDFSSSHAFSNIGVSDYTMPSQTSGDTEVNNDQSFPISSNTVGLSNNNSVMENRLSYLESDLVSDQRAFANTNPQKNILHKGALDDKPRIDKLYRIFFGNISKAMDYDPDGIEFSVENTLNNKWATDLLKTNKFHARKLKLLDLVIQYIVNPVYSDKFYCLESEKDNIFNNGPSFFILSRLCRKQNSITIKDAMIDKSLLQEKIGSHGEKIPSFSNYMMSRFLYFLNSNFILNESDISNSGIRFIDDCILFVSKRLFNKSHILNLSETLSDVHRIICESIYETLYTPLMNKFSSDVMERSVKIVYMCLCGLFKINLILEDIVGMKYDRETEKNLTMGQGCQTNNISSIHEIFIIYLTVKYELLKFIKKLIRGCIMRCCLGSDIIASYRFKQIMNLRDSDNYLNYQLFDLNSLSSQCLCFEELYNKISFDSYFQNSPNIILTDKEKEAIKQIYLLEYPVYAVNNNIDLLSSLKLFLHLMFLRDSFTKKINNIFLHRKKMFEIVVNEYIDSFLNKSKNHKFLSNGYSMTQNLVFTFKKIFRRKEIYLCVGQYQGIRILDCFAMIANDILLLQLPDQFSNFKELFYRRNIKNFS